MGNSVATNVEVATPFPNVRAIGLVSAPLLMRLMSALLFGVSPFDPLTYGAVVTSLTLVALVATWLPARRATQVDPMSALRADG